MPASDPFVIAGGGLAGTPDQLIEAAGISASRITARELVKD